MPIALQLPRGKRRSPIIVSDVYKRQAQGPFRRIDEGTLMKKVLSSIALFAFALLVFAGCASPQQEDLSLIHISSYRA